VDTIESRRLYYDVPPAWDQAINKRILDTFKLSLEFIVVKAVPPADPVVSAKLQ